MCSWHFCQKSMYHKCMNSFLGSRFCSIGLFLFYITPFPFIYLLLSIIFSSSQKAEVSLFYWPFQRMYYSIINSTIFLLSILTISASLFINLYSFSGIFGCFKILYSMPSSFIHPSSALKFMNFPLYEFVAASHKFKC